MEATQQDRAAGGLRPDETDAPTVQAAPAVRVARAVRVSRAVTGTPETAAPPDTLMPAGAASRRVLRRSGHTLRAALDATVVIVVLAFGLFGVGSLTHRWRLVPVLSNSMRPKLVVGSAVLVTPMPAADVRAGDIIVFHAPTAPYPITVHRVHRVVEPGAHPVVQTKGDANSQPDPHPTRLTGATAWKVRLVIPGLGKIMRDRWLLTAMFAVAVLALIVSAIRWAWRATGGAGDVPRPARGEIRRADVR